MWGRDGEVFFQNGRRILSVTVAPLGASLEVSKPCPCSRLVGRRKIVPAFDVTPDGRQFFMLRTRGRPHVSLILNWPRALAQLAASRD